MLPFVGFSLAKRSRIFAFRASSRLKYFPVAIFVISLVWNVGIEAQEPSEPDSNTDSQETTDNVQTSDAPAPIEVVVNAPTSENREQTTEYYEKSDQQSQLRMADSAEASTNYTGWLLALTAAEVAAIIYVLILSIRANQTSGNAVEIATEANRIAKSTLEIGNRAWISFANIKHIRRISEDKAVDIEFWINWVNTGQTPATNCNSFVDIRIIDASDCDTSIEFAKKEDVIGFSTTIGRNGDFSGGPIHLPVDTVVNVAKGEKRLFFWGLIEYQTIFGDGIIRITEFCVELKTNTQAEDITQITGNPTFTYKVFGDQNRAN